MAVTGVVHNVNNHPAMRGKMNHSGIVLLQAERNGFVLTGTNFDTCEFIDHLAVGSMSNGIRHLLPDECTDELLSTIEDRFCLKLGSL